MHTDYGVLSSGQVQQAQAHGREEDTLSSLTMFVPYHPFAAQVILQYVCTLYLVTLMDAGYFNCMRGRNGYTMYDT